MEQMLVVSLLILCALVVAVSVAFCYYLTKAHKYALFQVYEMSTKMHREALFTLKAQNVDQIVAAEALKDQYDVQTAGMKDALAEWQTKDRDEKKEPRKVTDVYGNEWNRDDLEIM